MMGRDTRIPFFILFAFVLAAGPAANGYGGSIPEVQVRPAADRHVGSTSEVEIYRDYDRDHVNKLKMIELCRKLEDDWILAEANRKSEVEVYREHTKPGVTEYRREVRESNRFAAPADERKTIELCHQLEDSLGASQKSEVRVYRETTIPSKGWWHRNIHPEEAD